MSGNSDSDFKINEGERNSHLFIFSGVNKAGMATVDKQKQAQVIYDMSKNSSFFRNAKRMDEKNAERIAEIKRKISCLNELNINTLNKTVHSDISSLEQKRNFSRICCVLDMDMFFAAVEIRDNPQYRDLPVAVGDMNMISTSNYVARKFGVRSAMPGFIGKKLCPDLIFLPYNFDKYRVVSDQVKNIISEYDPHFTSFSLDEVYFDITAATEKRLLNICSDQLGNQSINSMLMKRQIAYSIVSEIRQKIENITNGLTASAGIANNFNLAKMAAEVNKPNGQYAVEPSRQQIMEFIDNLPVRKVGGIGKVMENILQSINIRCISDIYHNLHIIKHVFTEKQYSHLLHACLGVAPKEGFLTVAPKQPPSSIFNFNAINKTSNINDDTVAGTTGDNNDSRVSANSHDGTEKSGSTSKTATTSSTSAAISSIFYSESHSDATSAYNRKSISSERTFAPTNVKNDLLLKLYDLSLSLSTQMIEEAILGQLITIKLKFATFELKTRSLSLHHPVQHAEAIFEAAMKVISKPWPKVPLRLLGICISKLSSGSPSTSTQCANNSAFGIAKYLKLVGSTDSSLSTATATATSTEQSAADDKVEEAFSRKNRSGSGSGSIVDVIFPSSTSFAAVDFDRQDSSNVEENILVGGEGCGHHGSCVRSLSDDISSVTGTGGTPVMIVDHAVPSPFDSIEASFSCPICSFCLDDRNVDYRNAHINKCLLGDDYDSYGTMGSRNGSQHSKRRKGLLLNVLDNYFTSIS